MKIQVVALVCLSSVLFGVSEGWAYPGKQHELLKNTKTELKCDSAQKEAALLKLIPEAKKECDGPSGVPEKCRQAKAAIEKVVSALKPCARERKVERSDE